MKIAERGQVTIPKEIRDRFGLGPDSDVEFSIVGGIIVLKKAPKKLDLQEWRGRCKDSLALENVASEGSLVFPIGAHAHLQASRLLSRDRGFYGKLFPKLSLIDPSRI